MGFFDASNPSITTPNAIAVRRLQAQALANRIGTGAVTYGGGIGDLFRGLASGLSNYRSNQDEAAGNASGLAATADGQDAVAKLNYYLSQPTNTGVVTAPSNTAVTGALTQGMATGKTPALAVYTPPAAPGQPGAIANAAPDPTQGQPAPVPMSPPPVAPAPLVVPPNPSSIVTGPKVAPAGDIAPAPTPMQGVSQQEARIMAVLNNPWVTDSARQSLQSRLAEIQQQQDPAYKQRMQLTAEQIASGKLSTFTDKNSGDVYGMDPTVANPKPFLIHKADAADATSTKPTADIQNYNFAKAAGYTGSFVDFQNAVAGRDTGGGTDDKTQQKLEQQFRPIVAKELSSRSGGLGMQDAKVNQAIHLRALVDQYKSTDAQGNVTYNIPTSQYHELGMGLASLVSPGGTTSDNDRKEINAKTAAGDYNGMLQYITGEPQNGNTQDMIKNLIDSIDRQGSVAEEERGAYVNAIKQMAPTDLDPVRRDKIMSGQLNSFVKRYGTASKPARAISTRSDYEPLQSGDQYMAPDGSTRTKTQTDNPANSMSQNFWENDPIVTAGNGQNLPAGKVPMYNPNTGNFE